MERTAALARNAPPSNSCCAISLLACPYCRGICSGTSCSMLSTANCGGPHDVLLRRTRLPLAPLTRPTPYYLILLRRTSILTHTLLRRVMTAKGGGGVFAAEFARPVYPPRGQHLPPHYCSPGPACGAGGVTRQPRPPRFHPRAHGQ